MLYKFFNHTQITSLQLSWRNAQLNAVDFDRTPETDDDGSLYRLFGFALHVGIKFRNKVLHGRLRSWFRPEKRRRYGLELTTLKSLVETDKSVLPAVVKFQDRGKMTFPHQILLPFMRKCSESIKSTLNCKNFKLQGRTIILKTKQSVLNNLELKADLAVVISFRCGETSASVVDTLYKDLLRRVINTMANSLIQSQAMLARIVSNKGVDAEMSLRDKLKAYAMDKRTQIQL